MLCKRESECKKNINNNRKQKSLISFVLACCLNNCFMAFIQNVRSF